MNQIRPQLTVSSRTRKKRLIIVNKLRFVLMSLLTLIILSIFLSYITGFFMSEASTINTPIEVEIVAGDTLWNLAATYNYYEEDLREVVYRIKTYNALDNGYLKVGQIVKIPMGK